MTDLLKSIFPLFFFMMSCTSSMSKEDYCSLRDEALTGSDDALHEIATILNGDGTLKLSDKKRKDEFALFAKILLQENGISERNRIAFGLGILEYGMPRVFPRDDEAQQCVEIARTVEEIDKCLAHIKSWRNADPENPGPCPMNRQ